MRTLELMRVLSDREIGKVEAIIKAQKRQSLQQIYALLKKYRKREDIPACIWKRIFKQQKLSAAPRAPFIKRTNL